ncbi:hypothetical protein DFP73DRAFT_622335 [Morchella snyderi]|nr:hypothetical protein DFP73DRAFT_622335 [Morchella snyderi]
MINLFVLFVALLFIVSGRPLLRPRLEIEALHTHTPDIHPETTGAEREVYLKADTATADRVLENVVRSGSDCDSEWELRDVDTASSIGIPGSSPPSAPELSFGTLPLATKSIPKRNLSTTAGHAVIWSVVNLCILFYIFFMFFLPGTRQRLRRWLQACRQRCGRGRYCVCGFRLDVHVSWRDGEWRTKFKDGVGVQRDGGVNGWGVQVQEEEEGTPKVVKVKVPEKAFFGWRK